MLCPNAKVGWRRAREQRLNGSVAIKRCDHEITRRLHANHVDHMRRVPFWSAQPLDG